MQKQDIEKLTQANGACKQKLQRFKAKLKKQIGTKKRLEIKIKILEQKINMAQDEAKTRSTQKSSMMKKSLRSRKESRGQDGQADENECYEQL